MDLSKMFRAVLDIFSKKVVYKDCQNEVRKEIRLSFKPPMLVAVMSNKLCLAALILKILFEDLYPFRYVFIFTWDKKNQKIVLPKESKERFWIRRWFLYYMTIGGFFASVAATLYPPSLENNASRLHSILNVENNLFTSKSIFLSLCFGISSCLIFFILVLFIALHTFLYGYLHDIMTGINSSIQLNKNLEKLEGSV
jgi:NADH:ubiquinone oxidoreductase subunit 5 (subunit L)/multisubunit Na+/H+ antiporter MnhA subunit